MRRTRGARGLATRRGRACGMRETRATTTSTSTTTVTMRRRMRRMRMMR
jgi:hypothetical protein